MPSCIHGIHKDCVVLCGVHSVVMSSCHHSPLYFCSPSVLLMCHPPTTAVEPVCMSCLSLAVEVDVTAVNCDTLQVGYTVNPLPGGDTNKASLHSFVVEYRPIFGRGGSGTRSVPLNGNPAEGVLCLSGLSINTPYRVAYNVEVNTGVQIVLPLDVSDPEQLFTLRSCVQQAQCNETIIARKCELHHAAVVACVTSSGVLWTHAKHI